MTTCKEAHPNDPLFPDEGGAAPRVKWLVLGHGVNLRQRRAQNPGLQTLGRGSLQLRMVSSASCGLGPSRAQSRTASQPSRGQACGLFVRAGRFPVLGSSPSTAPTGLFQG